MTTPSSHPTWITASDIAELAGASRSTVSNWRNRYDDFPQPVAGTPGKPLFMLTDVQAWMSQHDRTENAISPANRLWNAFNTWRGEMLVDDLLEVAAGLITWKYLSEVTAASDVRLPEQQTWQHLRLMPRDRLAAELTQGVHDLYASNPKMNRVFDHLVKLPSDIATDLFDITDGLDPDEAATAFDGLLELFRRAGGRSGGESSTAPELVALLTAAAGPMRGTVYDPAAGTGGLLLAAAQRAPGKVEVVGQELKEAVWRTTVQRLLIHGVSAVLNPGDSLRDDAFATLRAETVLLDPPYGTSWRGPDLDQDPRWQFGTPPARNSEWAWVQHAIWHLAPEGRAFVLLPSGSTFRAGQEARIRGELIRRGSVETIVALPSGLAHHTSIPLTLWVLARPGETRDPDHVLLIDGAADGVAFNPGTLGQEIRIWRAKRTLPARYPFAVVPVRDLLAADATPVPARWITPPLLDTVDETKMFDQNMASLNSYKRLLGDLPDLSSDRLTRGDPHIRRMSVGQLAADGYLTIHRGSKVAREAMAQTGLPVFTAERVRHPHLSGNDRVDPQSLDREPTITRPGDILVVTQGPKIATYVDREGGAIAAWPVQIVRLGKSWITTDFLAASLSSHTNERFLSGTTIPRASLKDLEVAFIDPDEQVALVEYLSVLDKMSIVGRGMADSAERLAEVLTAAVSMGAVAIVPTEKRKKNGNQS